MLFSAFSSKMSYRRGLLMAAIFAFFQGGFPLMGALLGGVFKESMESVDHWIAFGLLLLVGGKMIVDALRNAPKESRLDVTRVGTLCLLGVATSIDAFVIGIAQAAAVMPGLSRSGSTIATGLLLGNKKEKLAQFSFLMVIPPILGEALLDVLKIAKGSADAATASIGALPLAVGFITAFVVGCLACKLMINIVKKGKLIWFAVYCALAGIATIIFLS